MIFGSLSAKASAVRLWKQTLRRLRKQIKRRRR